MKTLFVRGGALGDFVITLPVLDALLAEGRVDVAIHPRLVPLLPRGVGRVWDVAGTESLWMHGGADPVGYDRAVAFSLAAQKGLRDAGIPDVRAVDARPNRNAYAHFLSVLGLPPSPARIRVPDPDPPAICIGPGSGGAAKLWPHWEEVARHLDAVRWIGGPLEPGLPQLDLLATARAAARSVWLGPDSGPTHLAAAAGARVLAVFVATDPEIWAPPGAEVFPADADPAAIAARAAQLLRSQDRPRPP